MITGRSALQAMAAIVNEARCRRRDTGQLVFVAIGKCAAKSSCVSLALKDHKDRGYHRRKNHLPSHFQSQIIGTDAPAH
jgi:hypothetical protein